MTGELVDPVELAGDLARIRRYAIQHYVSPGRFPRPFLDDLVAETALEILERGARDSSRRFYPSPLLRFAMGDAARRLRRPEGWSSGRRIAYLEPLEETLEHKGLQHPATADELRALAVPPDVLVLEYLEERARLELEEERNLEREWEELPVCERQNRITEAARATGTTPPPPFLGHVPPAR